MPQDASAENAPKPESDHRERTASPDVPSPPARAADGPSAEEVSAALLAWYDGNARALPWRIPPEESRAGALPDPYHVWLSEVMLQQTGVVSVIPYFLEFTRRWPTVEALASAEDAEVMAAWAGLGYYARARNLLGCAREVVKRHGGRFPEDEKALLALPGIGPYTAAAIRAIAFQRRAVVVDGNVERVMARLFALKAPLPRSKGALRELAARLTPDQRPGDHAQALMDLGATICTPRSPACGACPLIDFCAGYRAGIAADLPQRERRKPRPRRFGTAFVAIREDGAILLEERPRSGLLGGMRAFPTSEWREETHPDPTPPLEVPWQRLDGDVRHVFTHFELELAVMVAHVPSGTSPPPGYFFMPEKAFRPNDLPSLMRKVWHLARSALS